MRAATPASQTPDLRHLLAADPEVPGLALLLDDEALSSWLAQATSATVASSVTASAGTGALRPYLRWKPGAGGVARVVLPGAGELFLAVWHRDAADKLGKTVQRAGQGCLLVDTERLAVLAGPGADRDLPGLVRLDRRGAGALLRRLEPTDERAARRLRRAAAASSGAGAVPGAGTPCTLAWKPQRRWVGRLDAPTGDPGQRSAPALVLRAMRPVDAAASAHGYRAVTAALGRSAPRLLGTDLRLGVLAVEHLPGVTLERLDRRARSGARATGRVLARLHSLARGDASAVTAAGVRTVPDEAVVVHEAAAQLELLAPDAGGARLAEEICTASDRLPPPRQVLVHGDLSADQVLLRPDGGVALLDLDEAGWGDAAGDLAGAAAAWWLSEPERAEALVAALHDGYGSGAELPAAARLRVLTAAHLLRRAAEPFRSGAADWPTAVRERVATARHVLHHGPPAAALTPGDSW